MSDVVALPVWNCEFREADGLTVGKLFKISCRGDIPVAWGEGNVDVSFPEKESTYTLVVLKTDGLGEQNAEFTVTGYKPGEHQPEYIRFIQSTGSGFEIVKPEWKIESVIPPGEQAMPFESVGPWTYPLPYWFLFALLALVLVIVGITVRTVRRYKQRAAILAELNRHKTVLAPVNQFYKDARGLRRRLSTAKDVHAVHAIVSDLNRDFRLYILRRFQVPALDWSDRAIADDIRRHHKGTYKRAAEPLRKTLRELSRLVEQEKILTKDVEQLQRMTLDAVENLERAK